MILKTPFEKQINFLKLLIKFNLNVTYRNFEGETTIHKVLKITRVHHPRDDVIDTTELIKVLLENGVQINQIDNEGYTELYLSILINNESLVKLLVKNNADVNQECKMRLPLVEALNCSNEKLFLALISGADVNKQDSKE